jgi:hypothetical protein
MRTRFPLVAGLLLLGRPALAHGAVDFRALGTAVILLVGCLVLGAGFLVWVGLSKKHVLRRWSNVTLFVVVLGFSGALVQALNNLIWDRIYTGEHFTLLASSTLILVPPFWLACLPVMRKTTDPRVTWMFSVAFGFLAVSLIVAWLVAEEAI